jgi:phenylpropionate dioxygenase-like ring-hydroxylating dioxygenase large terminal subunit
MNANLIERTSQAIRPWEDGAYFQSWFPLCLSSQLEPGKVLGRTFLNTRVVLYRDKEGKAVVQSAYCPHLGADLSLGSISDGELRCVYHQWQFNSEGRCTRIASGDPVPRAARIYNYPAAEGLGMVWAYNGEKPLFPVPEFPAREEELLYTVHERADQPVDAWFPAPVVHPSFSRHGHSARDRGHAVFAGIQDRLHAAGRRGEGLWLQHVRPAFPASAAV